MSRLHALLTQARHFDRDKLDQRQPVHNVVYNDLGQMVLTGDGLFNEDQSLPLTSWARQQICQRLNIPYRYLQRCPGQVAGGQSQSLAAAAIGR